MTYNTWPYGHRSIGAGGAYDAYGTAYGGTPGSVYGGYGTEAYSNWYYWNYYKLCYGYHSATQSAQTHKRKSPSSSAQRARTSKRKSPCASTEEGSSGSSEDSSYESEESSLEDEAHGETQEKASEEVNVADKPDDETSEEDAEPAGFLKFLLERRNMFSPQGPDNKVQVVKGTDGKILFTDSDILSLRAAEKKPSYDDEGLMKYRSSLSKSEPAKIRLIPNPAAAGNEGFRKFQDDRRKSMRVTS